MKTGCERSSGNAKSHHGNDQDSQYATWVCNGRADEIIGKTLNELVAKKAISLFGPKTNFASLSEVQKNQVYASIVESAGKSNPSVKLKMLQLSRAGKELMVLSLAISVYEIYTAENKIAETGKQIAINGAGIADGRAGGALAGLVCGPGAPVCVLIGGFVGDALATFEMGRFWG